MDIQTKWNIGDDVATIWFDPDITENPPWIVQGYYPIEEIRISVARANDGHVTVEYNYYTLCGWSKAMNTFALRAEAQAECDKRNSQRR